MATQSTKAFNNDGGLPVKYNCGRAWLVGDDLMFQHAVYDGKWSNPAKLRDATDRDREIYGTNQPWDATAFDAFTIPGTDRNGRA